MWNWDFNKSIVVEKEFVDEEYWETVRVKPAAQSNKNASSTAETSSKKKAPEKGQATLAYFYFN